MRTLAALIIAGLALGACSTATPTASAPGTQTFTGLIWTWDEQDRTITMQRAEETIRVNVTPDQFVGLQLHQIRTIRGTLAPPKEIERVMLPAPTNYAVVPKGTSDTTELTGKLVTVDANGIAAITSARGPMRVWVAEPNAPRFTVGNDFKLRVVVQPVDIVPREGARPDAPPVALAADPGDYATVVGKVMRVDPSGKLVVESPRGPIEVWVQNASRYKVGDMVQIQTSVHPS
jgi:hypothetical protein